MISQECYELGSKSSVIREIFSYGLKRKAEIGEDKVYDFSLGNPSIPAPESVKKAILELMELPPEKFTHILRHRVIRRCVRPLQIL